MRESTRRRIAALFVSFVVVTALPAQGKQIFQNASEGYRVAVSKAIKAVPTEPNERQVLAKWGGSLEFKDKAFRGKADCTVMLARIRKSKGPATGAGQPEKPDEKEDKSVRETSIESLNSGSTVEEFLKKRGFKSDLKPVAGEKVLKSRDGQEFVCREYVGAQFDDRKWEYKDLPVIRSYMLEDENEYFGFVALGPFVGTWRDVVEDMCKSFQRVELGAGDLGELDDIVVLDPALEEAGGHRGNERALHEAFRLHAAEPGGEEIVPQLRPEALRHPGPGLPEKGLRHGGILPGRLPRCLMGRLPPHPVAFHAFRCLSACHDILFCRRLFVAWPSKGPSRCSHLMVHSTNHTTFSSVFAPEGRIVARAPRLRVTVAAHLFLLQPHNSLP